MGHRIAPPIVPPTPVVVAAKLSPFPHPLPFAAQLEPSRGLLASSAHTSSSPAANGAFNCRPRVAVAIHPRSIPSKIVEFVDSELLLGILLEVIKVVDVTLIEDQ